MGGVSDTAASRAKLEDSLGLLELLQELFRGLEAGSSELPWRGIGLTLERARGNIADVLDGVPAAAADTAGAVPPRQAGTANRARPSAPALAKRAIDGEAPAGRRPDSSLAARIQMAPPPANGFVRELDVDGGYPSEEAAERRQNSPQGGSEMPVERR